MSGPVVAATLSMKALVPAACGAPGKVGTLLTGLADVIGAVADNSASEEAGSDEGDYNRSGRSTLT
jgi:hypothetical protein